MPYFVSLYGDRQANGEYVLSTSTDSLIVRLCSLDSLGAAQARATLTRPSRRPRSSPPVPSSAPSAPALSAASLVAASASGATSSCSAPASRCRRRRPTSRFLRSAGFLPVSASAASLASCPSYVHRSLQLVRSRRSALEKHSLISPSSTRSTSPSARPRPGAASSSAAINGSLPVRPTLFEGCHEDRSGTLGPFGSTSRSGPAASGTAR